MGSASRPGQLQRASGSKTRLRSGRRDPARAADHFGGEESEEAVRHAVQGSGPGAGGERDRAGRDAARRVELDSRHRTGEEARVPHRPVRRRPQQPGRRSRAVQRSGLPARCVADRIAPDSRSASAEEEPYVRRPISARFRSRHARLRPPACPASSRFARSIPHRFEFEMLTGDRSHRHRPPADRRVQGLRRRRVLGPRPHAGLPAVSRRADVRGGGPTCAATTTSARRSATPAC